MNKPGEVSVMPDIKTILKLIHTDPSVVDVDKEGFSLASQLFDIAEADVESDDCRQAIDTFEAICIANRDVPNLPVMFSKKLFSVAMSAYSAKKYQVAGKAFRLLAQCGDTAAKNNYAYMMRRHEIANITQRDHIKVLIKILRGGVRECDAFSLVNTALAFSLMLGDDESWHLADDIMQRVPEPDSVSVEAWWEKLARDDDDIEGYLVHFFLLRHKKIECSSLGSMQSIVARLKKDIDGFPDWLAEGVE